MIRNVLEMEQIWFGYSNSLPLFKGQTMRVPEGGHIKCLLGPSGVGKSTLLQLAMGQMMPQAGTIHIRGKALPVLQDFESMVLPWFSVGTNISWGMNGAANSQLDTLTRLLEIESILKILPGRVSGGQRQRMIMARALLRRPDILLLDEPFANLDAGSSSRILPRVRTYLSESKTSALWITHNIGEALSVADTICVLHADGALHDFSVTSESEDELLTQIQGLLK